MHDLDRFLTPSEEALFRAGAFRPILVVDDFGAAGGEGIGTLNAGHRPRPAAVGALDVYLVEVLVDAKDPKRSQLVFIRKLGQQYRTGELVNLSVRTSVPWFYASKEIHLDVMQGGILPRSFSQRLVFQVPRAEWPPRDMGRSLARSFETRIR